MLTQDDLARVGAFLNNSGTGIEFPRVDDISRALRTIIPEHYKIHQGLAFLHADNHTIAATGSHNHLFQTDSGAYIHMRVMNLSVTGGPFTMRFFEDAVVSSVGAPLTAFNLNRNSVSSSGISAFHSPVVSSYGLELPTMLIPGGKLEGGFSIYGEIEYVLKPGANYIINLVSGSAQQETANLFTFFYR